MAALKPKDMRIAIVAPSAPPHSAGGVASAHYNLWRALRQRGFDARLFTFYDNDVKAKHVKGIVRHGTSRVWFKRLFVLLLLPWRLFQPRKLAYQTAEILRNAPGALRMARSIYAFSPDTVLLSDHGAPGLWLHKAKNQRFVLISHHNPARLAAESGMGDFSRLDTRFAIWLENRVLQKVDYVLCPSKYMKSWFKRTYTFMGPISVAPNIIDLLGVDRIKPESLAKQLDLSRQAKIVYLPSAGSYIKGARYLIEIIDKLKATAKFSLGFYIPGFVEPDVLEGLNQHEARAHILLPGQVSYNKHIQYVKACDIAVSPALMENFSMAIVEAASLGLPVVAFKRGGNADIIDDGENGFLVGGLDVDAMARRSAEILNSPELSKQKRQTEKYTRTKFASEKVLDQYLRVLVPQWSQSG